MQTYNIDASFLTATVPLAQPTKNNWIEGAECLRT